MKSVSPSQITTFLRCPRLWWFQKVRRLAEVDKGHGHFGTVLHGVVERWLLAEGGRDPATGERVDLFPDGWHIARNKFTNEPDGVLDIKERRQVKKVVREAIENGYLMRWPNAIIEHRMRRPVLGKIKTDAYIDVLLEDGVIDHKTTSNFRYAESRRSLEHNIQLLFYAREVLERNPDCDSIRLAHIYYAKKPTGRQTKLVETWVDQAHVWSWWDLIRNTVRYMLEIEALTSEERWQNVDGPEDHSRACMAFGGCSFRTVCVRREGVTRYSKRVAKLIRQAQRDLKRKLAA